MFRRAFRGAILRARYVAVVLTQLTGRQRTRADAGRHSTSRPFNKAERARRESSPRPSDSKSVGGIGHIHALPPRFAMSISPNALFVLEPGNHGDPGMIRHRVA